MRDRQFSGEGASSVAMWRRGYVEEGPCGGGATRRSGYVEEQPCGGKATWRRGHLEERLRAGEGYRRSIGQPVTLIDPSATRPEPASSAVVGRSQSSAGIRSMSPVMIARRSEMDSKLPSGSRQETR